MEKELLEKITGEVKSELKAYASKEDLQTAIDKAVEEIKELDKSEATEKAINELKEIAEKQGEAMAKMNDRASSKEVKSIAQQLEEQKDSIAKIIAGDRTAKTTVLPTAITNNFNGQVVPGIGQLNTRQPFLQQLFAQSSIGADNQRLIRYMDQTAFTNNAGARTVGAGAGESAITWQGYNLSIESISHFIPVAKEMIDDYAFVASEINNSLMKYLMIRVEDYVIGGNGSSPQIKGFSQSATAWSTSATFAAPTVIEVIKTAVTQVNEDTKYNANTILMSHADVDALRLVKATDGSYYLPSAITNADISLFGVRVLATSKVTAGTLYVGDFDWGTFYAKPVSIEMGYNSTDFSERQVSIMANIDCALLIKSLDEGAFVYVEDIDAAVTSITAGA